MSNNEEEGGPVETDPVLIQINYMNKNIIIPKDETIRELNMVIIDKNKKNFYVNPDYLEFNPENEVSKQKKGRFDFYEKKRHEIMRSQEYISYQENIKKIFVLKRDYENTLQKLKEELAK